MRPGLARGGDLRNGRRRCPGGFQALHRMQILHSGVPVRGALSPPGDSDCRQMYVLFSQEVTGFIYPNELEIHWSILIVVYPYITGLVAGAFILASLVQVFNVKEVQPTYRLGWFTALAFFLF